MLLTAFSAEELLALMKTLPKTTALEEALALRLVEVLENVAKIKKALDEAIERADEI